VVAVTFVKPFKKFRGSTRQRDAGKSRATVRWKPGFGQTIPPLVEAVNRRLPSQTLEVGPSLRAQKRGGWKWTLWIALCTVP